MAEEGEGFLVELLRVADVGADDGVEGEVGAGALSQLGPVLFALDRELAAHGVLGVDDVLVDVGYVEAAEFGGGGEEAFADEVGEREGAHWS